MTPGELTERLLDFATRVGNIVDALPTAPLGRHIARRLIRSGTAAGPVYENAVAAQRPSDFSRGLRRALNSLRETRFWLRLIVRAGLLPEYEIQEIAEECANLCDILTQSIASARTRSLRTGQLGPWRADDTQFTVYGFQFAIISVGAGARGGAAGAGNAAPGQKP